MNGVGLCPSPNWYCSRVCDYNSNGFLAFGCRNNIVFLNVKSKPSSFAGWICTHQSRVTGVSWKPEVGSRLGCSCDEDGCVVVWDEDTKLTVKFHETHRERNGKVTAIGWSSFNLDIIVSCDDKGYIYKWNYKTGALQWFHPVSHSISCLAICPHVTEYIAVGYKNGLVLVYDVSKSGSVLHKLREHDDEIECLTWSPTSGETLSSVALETDGGPGLLASGCRDRTVSIWNVRSGQRMTVLRLPTQNRQRGRSDDQSARTRTYVTVCWLPDRHGEILSSSHGGELLIWELGKSGKAKWKNFVAGSCGAVHSRTIFNIISAGPYSVFTISMDRQIIQWSLASLSSICVISTLGGAVNCLALSSQTNRLAVGAGDNVLRVWNLSMSADAYDIQQFWQGIKSRLSAVAWHPTKEGWLAYATEDGRVGIQDTMSSKPPMISRTYHQRTVYSLSWGPQCGVNANAQVFGVYSCGDGVVLQHLPGKLNEDAVDVNAVIVDVNRMTHKPPLRTEVCWKPDSSVMAIGNADGSIDIYQACTLKHLCTVQGHRKLINCIAWHPEFSQCSMAVSQYSCFMASGACEHDVIVYNLASVLGNLENCSHVEGPVLVTENHTQLVGHKNRITSLSWSPLCEELLASVSFDHTAQVWNAITGVPIANYRGHTDKLLCVAWSPTVKDLVYSGGEDFSLQSWQINEQQFTLPPTEKPKRRKPKRKGVHKEDTPPAVNEEDNVLFATGDIQVTEQKQDEFVKPNEHVNTAAGDQTGMTMTTSHILRNLMSTLDVDEVSAPHSRVGILARKKKKAKSLFPCSNVRDNQGKVQSYADCIALADYIYGNKENEAIDDSNDVLHTGMFTDRRAVFRLLKLEGEHHKASGNIDYLLWLEIWKGNIGGALKIASETGFFSDYLVSLIPHGSSEVFESVCRTYAEQLITMEQHHKALLYLLACHRVQEALHMLLNNGFFKEAAVLAKIRLSPYDPLLETAYAGWADQLSKDGNYELAAKCFLALHKPAEAAAALTKRVDATSLKVAAHILWRAGEMEKSTLYALRYIAECRQAGKFPEVISITETQENLKVYQLSVVVEEILAKCLVKLNCLPNEFLRKLECLDFLPDVAIHKDNLEMCRDLLLSNKLLWEPFVIDNMPLLRYIDHIWGTCLPVTMATHPAEQLYKTLKASRNLPQNASDKMIVSYLANELTLCLLSARIPSLTLSGVPASVYHLVNCLDAVLQLNKKAWLFQTLCRLFFPFGAQNVEKYLALVLAEGVTLENLLKSLVDISTTIEGVSAVQRGLEAFYCRAMLYRRLENAKHSSRQGAHVINGDRSSQIFSINYNVSLTHLSKSNEVEQESIDKTESTSKSSELVSNKSLTFDKTDELPYVPFKKSPVTVKVSTVVVSEVSHSFVLPLAEDVSVVSNEAHGAKDTTASVSLEYSGSSGDYVGAVSGDATLTPVLSVVSTEENIVEEHADADVGTVDETIDESSSSLIELSTYSLTDFARILLDKEFCVKFKLEHDIKLIENEVAKMIEQQRRRNEEVSVSATSASLPNESEVSVGGAAVQENFACVDRESEMLTEIKETNADKGINVASKEVTRELSKVANELEQTEPKDSEEVLEKPDLRVLSDELLCRKSQWDGIDEPIRLGVLLFPHPVESAKLLLEYLSIVQSTEKSIGEAAELTSRLTSWLDKFHSTKEQAFMLLDNDF